MARWAKRLGVIVGVVFLLFIGVVWWFVRPAFSVDVNHPPQFVTHNVIDLASVAGISKYRSGAGHDYSSNGETCRSMKHYFIPPYSSAVETIQQEIKSGQGVAAPAEGVGRTIYAPMTGRIIQLQDEQIREGKQIWLRSDTDPSWSIVLFHVYPASGIHLGSHVAAGQPIGLINPGQELDVAAQALTLGGRKLVSVFQVMTDQVFAEYQARGISTRSELIISKADRNAHPLNCQGQQFTTTEMADPLGAIVYLAGYSAAEEQVKQLNGFQSSGLGKNQPFSGPPGSSSTIVSGGRNE